MLCQAAELLRDKRRAEFHAQLLEQQVLHLNVRALCRVTGAWGAAPAVVGGAVFSHAINHRVRSRCLPAQAKLEEADMTAEEQERDTTERLRAQEQRHRKQLRDLRAKVRRSHV